jgi:hypothetical protein
VASDAGAEASSDAQASNDAEASTPDIPPSTWREHWKEHTEELTLIDYDSRAALYFDADVDRTDYAWAFPFVRDMWSYVIDTYGSMLGGDRVYVVVHGSKFGGAHHGLSNDPAYDFRNTLDIGRLDPNHVNRTFYAAHEASLVVESSNNGMRGSPSFPLWGESKWAEFFQYDVYVKLNMTEAAEYGFDVWTAETDSFPRAGTRWFRDWFYPLWRDHGGANVMVNYFKLVAKYFPAANGKYTRAMNWGEYVHFTSGAANTDLKAAATKAFGWPSSWETEYQTARSEFPEITY